MFFSARIATEKEDQLDGPFSCQVNINVTYKGLVYNAKEDRYYLLTSLYSLFRPIHDTDTVFAVVSYKSQHLDSKSSITYQVDLPHLRGSHKDYLPNMIIAIPLPNLDLQIPIKVFSHSKHSCGNLIWTFEVYPSVLHKKEKIPTR